MAIVYAWRPSLEYWAGRRASASLAARLFQKILRLTVWEHSIIGRGHYAHQMMRAITINFPRNANGATNQAAMEGRDSHKVENTLPARYSKGMERWKIYSRYNGKLLRNRDPWMRVNSKWGEWLLLPGRQQRRSPGGDTRTGIVHILLDHDLWHSRKYERLKWQ